MAHAFTDEIKKKYHVVEVMTATVSDDDCKKKSPAAVYSNIYWIILRDKAELEDIELLHKKTLEYLIKKCFRD